MEGQRNKRQASREPRGVKNTDRRRDEIREDFGAKISRPVADTASNKPGPSRCPFPSLRLEGGRRKLGKVSHAYAMRKSVRISSLLSRHAMSSLSRPLAGADGCTSDAMPT